MRPWPARQKTSWMLALALAVGCAGPDDKGEPADTDPHADTDTTPPDSGDTDPDDTDPSDTDPSDTDPGDTGPLTPDPDAASPGPRVDCPDGHADYDPAGVAPPTFVLVITVDTLNRDFLGRFHDWDTTPRLDRLFSRSVVLENVLVPRGLSAPSLATIITGAYPRKHGIRENQESVPRVPMLQERFQSAGWQTIGVSGNMCFLASEGIDQYYCNWGGLEDAGTGTVEADQELTDALLAALDARDPDRPTFAWLHLMAPHDPYEKLAPYFDEFHPEPYDGEFAALDEGPLAAMQLGELDWTDADRTYLHAAYASELRGTDELIGQVLDGVEARGLADDAIIVFASDHGEELGIRDTRYLWHGCSIYNPVLAATYAIHAPGRVASGETLRGWVSAADLAPTVLSLAQVPFGGDIDGHSLVPDILACTDPGRPVYFERATGTAGVIAEGVKFTLDPDEGYEYCRPYGPDAPYPGKAELLFDLAADPGETTDLADTHVELAAAMRATLCGWITDTTWTTPAMDAGNVLVQACAPE